MQAVILAGGEGSRLRPLTRNRPKAMIPVGNHPILASPIQALLKNGIREIIVVVGYRAEQVLRYLNRLDHGFETVVQEKQLGTAHALSCARDLIGGDFLVVPGDNWIDAGSIARLMRERNAMLVKEHPRPSNFGVVRIRDGYVTGIVEKPRHAQAITVSTGILSLTPSVFDHIVSTEIPDALMHMLRSGERIRAIEADAWHDVLFPWDLLEMNVSLLQGIESSRAGTIDQTSVLRHRVQLGKGSVIHPNSTVLGPCTIGEGTEIGPNAVILPHTSIGSRVEIGPNAVISESIVMDDTAIGTGCVVRRAVIGEGCVLEDHVATLVSRSHFCIGGEHQEAAFGAILGDQVQAAPFTLLKNCIVGNGVRIQEGRTITGTLPDETVVM